jgi:hypothetical protein
LRRWKIKFIVFCAFDPFIEFEDFTNLISMTAIYHHGETEGPSSRAVPNHAVSRANSHPAVSALQKKGSEKELQMKRVAQLAKPEEEAPAMRSAGQLKSEAADGLTQRKGNIPSPGTNHIGMPDKLKPGAENLSGFSTDEVKVHYNAAQPAQLDALAYVQGANILIGSGQQRQLPHEAWHVVQQKRGGVRPPIQSKGIVINDDKGLGHETDVIGEKAMKTGENRGFNSAGLSAGLISSSGVVQTKKAGPFDIEKKYAAKVANYSEYKDLDQKAFNKLIYGKLSAIYDENLAKGIRYWDNLKNANDSFKGNDNSGFLKTQEKKQKDYNAKFDKNYIHKVEEIKNSKDISVSSIGLAHKKDKGYKGKDIPYANEVSFEDNSITASHNYAERDRAREQDVNKKGEKGYKPRGLPNSEILWQQYKLAARSHSKIHKDSKAKDLIKGLSVVKRRQVQNTSTQMTILFALPDDKTDLEGSHAWQAGSEEFLAMLGTPNCSGAAFLLADHVNELEGKSITEIKLLGGQDVNLDIEIG